MRNWVLVLILVSLALAACGPDRGSARQIDFYEHHCWDYRQEPRVEVSCDTGLPL